MSGNTEGEAPGLSRYVRSESAEIRRSEICLAGYNPRRISEEARRSLKRGIREFGLVGGIIVNRRTGMTLVSGHQRLSVMDELQKYPENDYVLRADVIDVDEKQEKTLNILLNNPNSQGTWDMDALARLVPDIDYRAAGLTDADLSLIGLDYLHRTEGENELASALEGLTAPLDAARDAERRRRKAEREAAKAAKEEMSEEDRTAHMKDVKASVREKAVRDAENMDAYVVLSFDAREAKEAFLNRFGYPGGIRFIKGEEFDGMVEMTG